MLQTIHLLPPNSLNPSHHLLLKPFLSPPLTFLHKPTSTPSLSSNLRPISQSWPLFAAVEEGPIELSPDTPSIFATNDDPTPLQVSTSVLLTGAITVFLFRSIRRRAKRAKELRMRASGAKSLKEEALDSLKAIGSVSIEPKTSPSPVQAFLGAITAAVIAAILTIINGLCYLATFVFGFNALGLFLYSGKLTLDSLLGETAGSNENATDVKDSSSPNLSSESASTQENNDTDQIS
uniref:Transmembrane protein n=1 Tax=Chenopodium quinoa TaxID=63459 RepID=A0A803LVJ0_CHEQI